MEEIYKFSDDMPGRNAFRDDKLGFRPFASRLAKVLLSMDAPNGYVIGLHGVWGSGKSTALNFVRQHVEKHNQEIERPEEQVVLIEFQPWLISGHQDLIGAFFKVLSERLPVLSEQPSNLLGKLQSVGKKAGDPIIDAAAAIGALFDPTAGIGSKAVATVAKSTLKDRLDRWQAIPSLQSSYQTLVVKLAQQKRRIVVFIDDVDRLSQDEIRNMMQLVKSVGRLPYVTYVLAYDRRIVWAALDREDSTHEGPRFAEKIIQHELELPRPTQNALLRVFDSAARDFLDGIESNERLHRIVLHGLYNWIATPRDAIRLANAIKFSWGAIRGEIDPHDLLAMEGLRVFDYDTFQWLRKNRGFLIGDDLTMLNDDERKKIASKLRTQLTENDKNYVIELLANLFPGREKELRGGLQHHGEPYYSIVKRGGVGAAQGYDAYFSLFPPEGEISKSAADSLASRLDDREYIEQMIVETFGNADRKGEPLVGSFLAQLHYRMLGNSNIKPTTQLLAALMATGDKIVSIEWTGRWFAAPAYIGLSGLLREMVKRWGQEMALQEFCTVAKDGSPLMSSFLLAQVSPSLASQGADRDGLLTEDQANELAAVVQERIRDAIGKKALHTLPDLWPVFQVWRQVAQSDEIKNWVSETLSNHPSLLAKLPIFRTRSASGDGVDYSLGSKPDPSLFQMEDLVSAANELVANEETDKVTRAKAEAILRGVRDGIPDYATDGVADDDQ
ncbi:P-loop NTPase fold protein [Mesorhizobium sp. DCY119]|uniref:KAP family P-loop NTPase fold protein n=1 Tax=Mesorhizobium sp. DCY119 TaxID=2108445 RepID=UPI000E6C9D23|nr:P-loop NTPase fold protein [Mesorhizobium sp. DCY119]RJG46447.1 hypothetical protein D3Y55_20855 [Mesorhizobium sp. DCY119]